ncbi:MAG TPA: DivIVA domain-containing protein [Acidimicrobiales bacterium]|nr:DivIVA domain-containing protein [Acidimicrobiales bacterium]
MADSPLDPDAIARKTFLAGFRGYEQQEVRAYLHDLGQQARRVQQRLADAERRLAELEPLADELDAPIDPSRLAQLVGEETARVLEAARAAADEITSKAEEAAARVVSDATAEAQALRQAADDDARSIRDEADQMLARKSEEAEDAAEEVLARAERDATTKREDAEADRARAFADAERLTAESTEQASQVIEDAKAQGRAVVTEAKALRQKVLEDLGRRRQVARAQVARLNAGRERLLVAYETVQRSLDEATGDLNSAVGEARAAADTAALRIQDEPTPTVEELEAELGIAADADLLDDWDDSTDDADVPEPVLDGEVADDAVSTVDGPATADSVDAAAPTASMSPSATPVVTSAELPEIDADLEPEPVEDPPPAIVLPRKSPKRRLLRRDSAPTSTLLPPAELVPLTERHEVEGVRLVPPASTDEIDDDSAAEPGEADGEAGDSAHEATAERVDALFARIRAERADALDGALDVLDDGPTGGDEAEAGVDDSEPVELSESDSSADQGELDEVSEAVPVDPAEEVSDDQRFALRVMNERDEALAPLARELSKRLKRALADEQNELLDAIRRAGDDDVLAHLPDLHSHASVYATVAGSALIGAAEAGVSATGDAAAPDTADIARKMAEAICVPLRDRFENAREGADGDPDELDTRLRACYREWKTTVLPDVGEDALVAAWSAGVVAATPDGCGLRWLVAPGSAPCPDAEDNALEGVIEAGASFPTGDAFPPAHPGCRCLVVPITE